MVRVSGSRARAGRRGSAIGLLNSEDDTAYAANAQKYGNADRGSYMERVRQTMETMQERIEDFSSMQIPPATATAAATAAATTTTTAFNNILIGGTKTNDDAPAESGWATMQDDSFGDMSFNNKNNDHGEFGVSAFDFPESTTAAKEFDDHHNDDGFGPVFVAPNSAKEEDDDQNKVKDLSTVVSDWMKQVKDVDMHPTSDEGLKEVCTAQECILSDGTGKPLRYIEPDQGISLIEDHMAPAYRSSIANILSSRRIIDNTVTVESDGSGDNN